MITIESLDILNAMYCIFKKAQFFINFSEFQWIRMPTKEVAQEWSEHQWKAKLDRFSNKLFSLWRSHWSLGPSESYLETLITRQEAFMRKHVCGYRWAACKILRASLIVSWNFCYFSFKVLFILDFRKRVDMKPGCPRLIENQFQGFSSF